MGFVSRSHTRKTALEEPRPNVERIECDTANDSMIRITPDSGRCHSNRLAKDQSRQLIPNGESAATLRASQLRSINRSQAHVLDARQQLPGNIDLNHDRISITNTADPTGQRLT